MKTAKIGAMFMITVMALTAIGVSYAHWEEKLYVEGIMYTDDIDPCFENAISNDPPWDPGMVNDEFKDPWECGSWPADGAQNPWDWIGERRNKDVGSCEIAIDPNDCTRLSITIMDAYPCYYAHPYWEVVNYGSVPVNLYSYTLRNLSFSPDVNTDPVVVSPDFDMTICTTYLVRWNWDDVNNEWVPEIVEDDGTSYNYDEWDFSFHPTGDFQIGDQLDPDTWEDEIENGRVRIQNEEPCFRFHSDLCIHFLNSCEQLAVYDFDIEMVFWNWPEGDPETGCDPDEEELIPHNADLMLVLDTSNSIITSEMTNLKTAANAFITAIHADDAITGMTQFNDVGSMELHLTNSEANTHAAINALPSDGDGWTNMYEGLDLAYDELMLGTYDAGQDLLGNSIGDRILDSDFPDFIIVITDGETNRPLAGYADPMTMAKDVADDCDAAGIIVYVVGVGIPTDTPPAPWNTMSYEDYLENYIANCPECYFSIDDYADLEQVLLDLVGTSP